MAHPDKERFTEIRASWEKLTNEVMNDKMMADPEDALNKITAILKHGINTLDKLYRDAFRGLTYEDWYQNFVDDYNQNKEYMKDEPEFTYELERLWSEFNGLDLKGIFVQDVLSVISLAEIEEQRKLIYDELERTKTIDPADFAKHIAAGN